MMFCLFHKEYSDAKEEKTFNIVQINDNYYAIINENSQEYSMYQCFLIMMRLLYMTIKIW